MKKYVVKFDRIGRARQVREFYADGPDSMTEVAGWDEFALKIEKFARSYLISSEFDVSILRPLDRADDGRLLRTSIDGGRFGEGTIELAPVLDVEGSTPRDFSSMSDRCRSCAKRVGLTRTGRFRKHEGPNPMCPCHNSGRIAPVVLQARRESK